MDGVAPRRLSGLRVAARAMIVSLAALVTALMAAPDAAAAESPWPVWVSALPRAVPESPVAARLPEAIPVTPQTPASSATSVGAVSGVEAAAGLSSPSSSDWTGAWQGWACIRAACDVRLVIDPPSATAAGDGASTRRLTVAMASSAWSLTEQVEAAVVGREWQATLTQGRRLALRARDDGDLELGVWSAQGAMLMMGVVSQKPPPYRREVRWIDTPWTESEGESKSKSGGGGEGEGEGGGQGEGKDVRLEALIHRPTGPGPYPTLVFHHGSTGVGNRPEFFRVTWSSPAISAWFTARGWQVVYPQRRGRGQSGGRYGEGFTPDRSRYSCEVDPSLQGAERALADIDLALKAIRRWPDVMAGRLVVGGVSRGGVLAVVQAGRDPELAAGVINSKPVAGYLDSLKAGSEDWQLAGTQGVVRVVIVPADRVRDADGYQRQIDRLCPPGDTCFVNFHTNSTGADVTLPLPDAIAQEVTARFRRSAKVGREVFEWRCDLKIEDAPCF